MPRLKRPPETRKRLEPVRVRRIDWVQVLMDVRGTGMTLSQITQATGISKATLLEMRGDYEPKMSTGENLLALWGRETKRSLADVPRRGEACGAMKARYVASWEGGAIHCPLCGAQHAHRAKAG